MQTEGQNQQQQSQLEKEQLRAWLEEAHQKLAKLEQDAIQTSLKAAQELETLQHNHAISQVSLRPYCMAWCRCCSCSQSERGPHPLFYCRSAEEE